MTKWKNDFYYRVCEAATFSPKKIIKKKRKRKGKQPNGARDGIFYIKKPN